MNITTLDDFTNQNHLPKIDLLKTDTEGYEPLVFRGAKQLLQEHRIRLFIFEHLIGNYFCRILSLEKYFSLQKVYGEILHYELKS